jgi:hypothetical protein
MSREWTTRNGLSTPAAQPARVIQLFEDQIGLDTLLMYVIG